jgi:ribonuclease Z
MQSSLRVANISRIFITHMHADHVLGLVWVLSHVLSGIGTTEESRAEVAKQGLEKKVSYHVCAEVKLIIG